jgi:ribonuclease-3
VAEPDLAALESLLGLRFRDRSLLRCALTHSSLEAEQPGQVSNERLEFLGDAVLGLVIAAALYEGGDLDEGAMAKVRAAVVDTGALAGIARDLDLGRHLRLGRGEVASGGADKDSILADALEAVIGAMYVDGGIGPVREFILDRWDSLVMERAAAPGRRDYKTRLQEFLAQRGQVPEYTVTGTGPDHERSFTATVAVDGQVFGAGEGTSKKRAEREAARRALDRFARA